jgi:predicted phage terminase large subunit-like protein
MVWVAVACVCLFLVGVTLDLRPPLTEEAFQFDEDVLQASILKDSFWEFVQFFWDEIIEEKPVWNWHIPYLCRQLQKTAERVIARRPKKNDIVINIPPGTTKSTICSIMLNAWMLAKDPSIRFLGASYAHNLAQDLSRKTRDLVKSERYRKLFPHVKIREDQDSKSYFVTTRGGGRYAIGSGGVVVGMHFHVIVIDDPIDPESAYSDTEVAEVNRWISNTLSQRKVDKKVSVTILVMQRLGKGDPTDHALAEWKRVKHYCIPADTRFKISPSALRAYYTRTKYGYAVMDPTRMPPKVLKDEEKKGNYHYSSQYGQDPVPLGGGMFQTDFLHVDEALPDKFKNVIRFWDKAATEGGGAFSVGVKMGEDFAGRFWVLHVWRRQVNSARREYMIDKFARMDGKFVSIGLEQEPGSGGKESAEKTAKRLKLLGYKVSVVRPQGDKVVRADPLSVQVNDGNVYLVKAAWNKEYVDEMKHFPNTKYKDQIDASSGAYTELTTTPAEVGGW